jgi:hypothetical protein
LFILALSVRSQTSYTWNGSASTAWNNATNWTPNGIPGSADNVTIVTGSNTCQLNATSSINNFTLTSGTLDLGGFTLTVAGPTVVFTKGTVQNGAFTVSGATTTNFGAGPTVMNVTASLTSATITIRNTTFQNALTVVKTGSTNDASAGNNVFNGTVTMTNNGTGYLLMGNGNPDQFNAPATFNNNGSADLYVAYNSTNNIFNGVVTFNNNPATNNLIYVSQNSAGTQFNDNILVSSNSGQGVHFCNGNNTATATLAAGKTITVGAGGFSAGTLLLRQFTQSGTTAQSLTLTGTSTLTFGPTSSFGGNVTSISPALYLNGCTFSGTSNFTKTGTTGDWSNGGNTFNDVCSFTNSGSSYLLLGSTNPDTWNNDVTFTDNGSERLLPCWSSAGNQFNGNIYVNTSGSATGIQFCGGNATATATIAAGKTMLAGATGLTAGYLQLRQFTQLGNTPVTLTATGNSALFLGPNSNFGGPVTVTAPDIWAQGAVYNSAATFNKTGGSNNHNNQNQNIFNSTVTINQQSSGGYFMLGYNSNDQFNDNITVSCTGTGGIYLGWTSGTGTPTLAAGKTIQVGAAGFSAGFLSMNTFTQLGNAPINLAFTGTNTGLTFAHNSVIGGNVTSSSPDIYLSGCAFNGLTNFTKTGSGGDNGTGGNVFNDVCSITNSGSGYLLMGSTNPDTWNANVTFTDNGSERLLPCWASAGNQFNGNIFVNTGGSATGILFCGGNATATATMAAGMTIQSGGTGLTVGYLQLRQFTQLGNAPITLTGTGTTAMYFGPNSNFGGPVTATAPDIWAQGAVYNGAASFTKTGGGSNHNQQNQNIFNSTVAINQQSNTGYFMLGYNSNDLFNDNITVTSTGTGGIYLGWVSGTGTPTLAAGKTILVGAAGFSAGLLSLNTFTQLGNAPVNLAFTGTNTNLTFARNTVIGGDLTSSSPDIYLNGATFNGATNITKTGANGNYNSGGNTFAGVSSITNSGAGFFLLGNVNPDIWNNDVTFTDNGSERLLPGWASAGNQFNGNIYVNTAGSALGIQFSGGNNTATSVLAAGKTIQTGATGLTSGYLILKQFTQAGNAAISLTLSSTATYLQYGPSSNLGGDVVSSSPGLFFNGCTFNGNTTCTKTGASNDQSIGNNIFNTTTTITDAGAGYLMLGNGNRDQFNSTATFNNMGGANLYVAYNSTNNVFGGVTTFNNTPTANTLIYVSPNSAGTGFSDNIIVTSTNGQGVQFCTGNTSATATLAAGKTISIGGGGFSAGTLNLRQFTQAGNVPVSLTLTGTGNLTFGPLSAIGGNITSVSPTLFFNGCNFGGTVTATKNGSTSDGSIGNNMFNGAFAVTNTGNGYLLMGNGNPDVWQSTAIFNNQSPGQHMYIAYNSTGNTFNGDVTFTNQAGATGLWIYPNYYGVNTQFNGNIIVNNVSGSGVYFGTGTGTATLASGKTITTGGPGFSLGSLIFRNFTQSGATAQNITTTGTSTIQYGPSSSFSGAVTSSSPGLLFNSAVFNGTVNSTKTGSSNDQSVGNNTFNAAGVFTNNGTGYLMMTNTSPDAYNSDVTFIKNGTGAVYPNYNGNSTYAGNISITSPAASAITFGASTGTATLTGSSLQNINATAGSAIPVFTRLVISNTGAGVTLNSTSINVSSSLTLSSGLLNTSTTYILTMLNGSTTAAGNSLSTSYVNGPMRYQKSVAGGSTLNFPIGASPDCRPVILTVNHTNGTVYYYQAQLFDASAAALGYTLPPSVDRVSGVHYYTIGRTDAAGNSQPTANLSGNQTIQIFFGNNDVVTDGSTLTIVKNVYTAPTNWIDIGGAGAPAYSGGARLTGSITSTSSPTAFNSFSTFALGNKIGAINVLPTQLLYFHAAPDKNTVDLSWATASESNNNYFTVERSRDGISFDSLTSVASEAINGNSVVPLDYAAVDPKPFPGTNYYRLKQTDLDGRFRYSNTVTVSFGNNPSFVSVYPNPTTGVLYINGLNTMQATVKVEWLDTRGTTLLQEIAPVQGGIARLIAHLNNGIYFLKFETADGVVHTQQVMIMK